MYNLSAMGSVVEARLAFQGKTLPQLADEMGVTTSQMARWLDGTQVMEFKLAASLADALGMSLDELAGRTRG